MAPQQHHQQQPSQQRALKQLTQQFRPAPRQDSGDSSSDSDDRINQLRACGHNGDLEVAEKLLFILEQDQQGSMDVYNFVIHACATAGNVRRAELHFARMEDRGFKPNLVTFNSMINSCAANGDGDGALAWLRRMVDRSIEPSAVTYSTICKVFARQGRVSAVQDMMNLYEQNGGTLNEYFYASLISACGVAEPADVKAAIAAFDDLVTRGLRPQSVKKALVRAIGRDCTSQLFAGLEASQRKPAALPATQARVPKPPTPPSSADAFGPLAAAEGPEPPVKLVQTGSRSVGGAANAVQCPEPFGTMAQEGPRSVGGAANAVQCPQPFGTMAQKGARSVGSAATAVQVLPPGLEQPPPGLQNLPPGLAKPYHSGVWRRAAALAGRRGPGPVPPPLSPPSYLPGEVCCRPPTPPPPPAAGLLAKGPKWVDAMPVGGGASGCGEPCKLMEAYGGPVAGVAPMRACLHQQAPAPPPPQALPLPKILAAGQGSVSCTDGLFQEHYGSTLSDETISDLIAWKAKAQEGRVAWRLHV